MTQAMLTERINKHINGKVGYKNNTYTNKDFYNLLIKDYNHNLSKIFSDVRNDSDIMTDYFEEDLVTFLEGSKEYSQLLPLLMVVGALQDKGDVVMGKKKKSVLGDFKLYWEEL